MRLLLIVEDPDCQSLLQKHVRDEWPGAEFVLRVPQVSNVLPSEFLAQGYDAVIVDQEWNGGKGLAWLRELAARRGFAPALFLVDSVDAPAARTARLFGAFGVLSRSDFLPATLTAVLTEASRVQRRALAYWRVSPEAEAARRFGTVRIPGYRCVRRLAGGSVSQLYLAESEKAGDLMVIKVTPSQRDASGIDQSFERFLQEYEIAHRLRHDSIVRCHELGVADDHAYLAMEYFPDGDLRRRIRAGVIPADALDLSAQIAGALGALHDAGALHRDLKPGNVLMRGTRQIALSDFGLAKDIAWDMEITDPGLIFGTPQYMSPEQGHGEPVDTRSDLYSLGVILYEMLSGEKPYSAPNPMSVIYMHRNQPIPRLPAPVAHWQSIIEGLLAKLPAHRYSSASEAERALRQAADTARGSVNMTQMDFLQARTPAAWAEAAARQWPLLLVDHANCEKKAASTALALMFAYPEDRELSLAMARLAREELRHFEQVQKLMRELEVPMTRLSPGRYASALRAQLAASEPRRKRDLLLAGALIEARSCERFETLAPLLPEPLAAFYGGLAASERRHAALYVELAEAAAPTEVASGALRARLDELARIEAALVLDPDPELRFHSGTPVEIAA